MSDRWYSGVPMNSRESFPQGGIHQILQQWKVIKTFMNENSELHFRKSLRQPDVFIWTHKFTQNDSRKMTTWFFFFSPPLGAPGKTRKKEPKKKSPEKDPSDAVLSPSTDVSSAVPGSGNCSDCGLVFSIEASTPKNEREKMRFAQEACLTSTPVYSTTYDVPSTISGSPPEGELQYTEFITQIKVWYKSEIYIFL